MRTSTRLSHKDTSVFRRGENYNHDNVLLHCERAFLHGIRGIPQIRQPPQAQKSLSQQHATCPVHFIATCTSTSSTFTVQVCTWLYMYMYMYMYMPADHEWMLIGTTVLFGNTSCMLGHSSYGYQHRHLCMHATHACACTCTGTPTKNTGGRYMYKL